MTNSRCRRKSSFNRPKDRLSKKRAKLSEQSPLFPRDFKAQKRLDLLFLFSDEWPDVCIFLLFFVNRHQSSIRFEKFKALIEILLSSFSFLQIPSK